MIDYWLMIFFNLFFTSAPPIMFGIMDKDLSAEMLLGVPELYRTGQRAGVSYKLSFFSQNEMKMHKTLYCHSLQEYNFLTFWISMLDGFYQSLVCFFIPYLVRKDLEPSTFVCELLLCVLFFKKNNKKSQNLK